MMQMLGLGLCGLTTTIAMLGIQASCWNLAMWHKIRDKVGEAEQTVCKEILNENLEKEINATKESGEKQVSFMNKWLWPLTCIIDFAWQRQSCGVAYNSLSGHFFFDWCMK